MIANSSRFYYLYNMKWKIGSIFFVLIAFAIINTTRIFAQAPVSPVPEVPSPTSTGVPVPPDTTVPTPTDVINPGDIVPSISPGNGSTLDNLSKGSCGFAGDTVAYKCCGTLDLNSSEMREKANVPNALDPMTVLDLNNKFPRCYVGAPDDPNSPSCKCILKPDQVPSAGIRELCRRFASTNEMSRCNSCADKGELLTGFGCIPVRLDSFINSFLLPRGISLAGIFAFFCIVIAAFRIQISRGDKEGLQKAKEMLTSCIIGLLLVIFAVFILRVIGVNILGLPNLR